MNCLKKWTIGAMLVVIAVSARSKEPLRWGERFVRSYEDVATGRPVSFTIQMPPQPKISPGQLPLVVRLKGGTRVLPSAELPFIEARPSGGGIWGYRSMSTVDVMAVINDMKAHYPIDQNRIYLIGFSAGASGAMHLASLHPDTFAAVLPMVAMGNDYPLRNFSQLPVAVHHGTQDWTSSICNARVQMKKLQKIKGHAAVLHEYPGAGHSVPGPHQPIVRWMLDQKRNPTPGYISIDCETPSDGHNRYLQITEFDDPHQRAVMEGSLEPDRVVIRSQNVKSFFLDFKGPGNRVVIDSQDLIVQAGEGTIEFRLEKGSWKMAKSESPSMRSYTAGAAANLYQGEPLLIVYGTNVSDPKQKADLRTAAEKLAVCGGPVFTGMSHTRFPIVADTALTPQQEAKYNLILVGSPEHNSIVKKLLPRLPIQINNRNLQAGNREPLHLEGQVLSMLYTNPDHSARLIYLLVPFPAANKLPATFVNRPQYFLSGSDGFHRVGQADLLVQDFQHRISREMHLGKDWQWIPKDGEATKIPSRFADRNEMALVYLAVMKRQSEADFALWWGPADKGMWGVDFNYLKSYQSEYSLADFGVKRRIVETMTGDVSGADLKIIEDRWIAKNELTVLPGFDSDDLVPEKLYRIHIPMDLYIKLGQRKKNLGNPKPGPDIFPGAIAAEIF